VAVRRCRATGDLADAGVEALNTFLQLLAAGVLTGLVFALVAVGLTLIYGVMDVVNFAHGEFLMLAMYVTLGLALVGIGPLVGLPFVAVALADPHTAFPQEKTSYPGRRIALLVDGSSSMVMKFETKTLKTPENRAFYTAVAAAEHFMKLRMNGRYHDLIALRRDVLTQPRTEVFHVDNANKTIAWRRYDDGGPEAVIIANFANARQNALHLELPNTGTWHVRFNSGASVYDSEFTDGDSGDVIAARAIEGGPSTGDVSIGP